jgi:hypothetical protein
MGAPVVAVTLLWQVEGGSHLQDQFDPSAAPPSRDQRPIRVLLGKS